MPGVSRSERVDATLSVVDVRWLMLEPQHSSADGWESRRTDDQRSFAFPQWEPIGKATRGANYLVIGRENRANGQPDGESGAASV